jgi:hypothetical protein
MMGYANIDYKLIYSSQETTKGMERISYLQENLGNPGSDT